MTNQPTHASSSKPFEEAPVAADDVRAAIRLLGQIADMRGSPVEKKHALMDGLCDLLGASAWLWVVNRFDPGASPTGILVHHGGLSDRDVGLIFEASQDTEFPVPENEPLGRLIATGKPFTRRRIDLVPNEAEWRGPYFELYREPIGLDEFLYGIFPLGGNLISGIGLHRKLGEPGFSERDRQLVHMIITEIPWLHRAGLPEDEAEGLGGFASGVMGLSPRLRTVFGLLLQGWKRPKIAEHLGISENTAKSHIREVYRHFEVEDHVALLRRFMETGDPIDAVT